MAREKSVNIAGLDKAELLAAFYNGARVLPGMGRFQARAGVMTREAALQVISQGDDSARMFPGTRDKSRLYFDYVFGKGLKVDLTDNEMDPWGYDRDYGQGAAEAVVNRLRSSK